MCQNAQVSISLDLPWCLQCKNGTPLPPYGGSNSNDPLQHTRLMQCTQRSNRTQEHKPTHRTPCAYGHSQRCTKCSRGKMAQHMEQQDLPQDQSLNTSHVHVSTTMVGQMLMWLHQGASAYAWWMWPLQAAGENPSQSDQTVRSFSCKDCTDMSTTM